jgi:hypothetical protein
MAVILTRRNLMNAIGTVGRCAFALVTLAALTAQQRTDWIHDSPHEQQIAHWMKWYDVHHQVPPHWLIGEWRTRWGHHGLPDTWKSLKPVYPSKRDAERERAEVRKADAAIGYTPPEDRLR